jgi:hypothetical protein
MPFLPSLLEYSLLDLQNKLELIKNNLAQVQFIQKSPDGKIYLHLDFVLPEFAASRSVQPGNDPKIVFDLINKYFKDQKIVCNCHFMGTKGDVDIVIKFFETYNWNPNWEYILFVGQEFVTEFEELTLPLDKKESKQDSLATYYSNGLVAKPTGVSIKIGTWLDFDQYSLQTNFEERDYLLMTVVAGKSGQKLTKEVRLNTLQLIQNNSDTNFTIDGGWAVTDILIELTDEQKNNLNVVSYSSFWKELEKVLIS